MSSVLGDWPSGKEKEGEALGQEGWTRSFCWVNRMESLHFQSTAEVQSLNWNLLLGRGHVLPCCVVSNWMGLGVSQGALLELTRTIVALCGCVVFHQVVVRYGLTISFVLMFIYLYLERART